MKYKRMFDRNFGFGNTEKTSNAMLATDTIRLGSITYSLFNYNLIYAPVAQLDRETAF